MSIAKKLQQKLEQVTSPDPRKVSRCHGANLNIAPVLVLERDGLTRRVGYMEYCSWADWQSRRKMECHAPTHVDAFRSWPESLSHEEAMKICDHIGPEYWLESGFHIFQWEGRWTTLRAHGGLPPWARRDFDALDPRAQRIVRMTSKIKSGGSGSKAIGDEFPIEALPASPKSMPRRMNAGLEAKRAKNLAEQLLKERQLDSKELASGEGAYEPGLEPEQVAPGLTEDEQRLLDQETDARLAFEIDEMVAGGQAAEAMEKPKRIPSEPKPDLKEFFNEQE